MGRDEIFSKINIKDYSNKLEKIIAKKAFSLDTKNLLLSMFYKMEVAYEDYNKVKVDTKSKREILEELIARREKNQLQLGRLKKSIIACEYRISKIQEKIDKIQDQVLFEELLEFASKNGKSVEEVLGLLYQGDFGELKKVTSQSKTKKR